MTETLLAPPTWVQDCRALLGKYRAHAEHAEKVARLADGLFTLTLGFSGLSEADRVPVVAAGFLHDLGHFLGPEDHHRHSRYVIARDEALGGWPAQMRAEVALLALNHRKRKRLGLDGLSREDRRRLRSMAAVLRLADVLDRDHHQRAAIHDVRLDTAAERVTVVVSGVDLEGLAPALDRKARWAADAWGLELEFVCGEASVRIAPGA